MGSAKLGWGGVAEVGVGKDWGEGRDKDPGSGLTLTP